MREFFRNNVGVIKIGVNMQSGVKISAVLGNSQKLDGGAMFGNVPRAMWETWHDVDDRGRIELNCRCLLAKFPAATVLFEAGIGAFFDGKRADRFGVVEKEHVLLNNLQSLGTNPEDIDFVILSHLHFDHAGGLMSAYEEGVEPHLVFPRAKFIVGTQAWERAQAPHPRDRASFIPELHKLLKSSGRLLVVDEDSSLPESLSPYVEMLYSNGHTPGQMHSLIKGEKGKVFFAGDLFPGKSWLHLPVTMGYDRFPELLIDEKRGVLQRAIRENWSLFFTHDPKIAMAKIAVSERGKFGAVEEIESVTDLHF